MPDIELVALREWSQLKALRLAALLDSPKMFLAQYEEQKDYTDAEWQAQLERSDWYSVRIDGDLISLVGITPNEEIEPDERFLEYLWVSPEHRNARVAHDMVSAVLDGLRGDGIRTVFLWVLDGNDVAIDVYRGLGFKSTDVYNPLETLPGRTEHQMILDLRGEPGDSGLAL